jgi:hypothetical protein
VLKEVYTGVDRWRRACDELEVGLQEND